MATPTTSEVLDFYMGSYNGYTGQKMPMIELTHATGSILRFFCFSRGNTIRTVWAKADGAVEMTERELAKAEELFVAATAKGYKLTANRPGMAYPEVGC